MTPVHLRNWVFHDVLEVNPVAVELDGQPNYPANGLRSNGQTACKLATCPSSRTLRLLAQGGTWGVATAAGCRRRPRGPPHRQRAQRCEVSQRVTRYWPVAPPVDSDRQVMDVDTVQPLLIVSSAAHGVID